MKKLKILISVLGLALSIAACNTNSNVTPTASGASIKPATRTSAATASSAGAQTTIPNTAPAAASQIPTADSTPETRPSGDIPDTATFLPFHAPNYSLQYVEGWAQDQLPNGGIRFADKDSFVTLTLQSPAPGTVMDYAMAQGSVDSAKEFQQFVKTNVTAVTLPAGKTAHLTFKALSAPNAVTGKQVPLDVDRYYIAGASYLAILTEATPSGVDNVDAFAQIAQSLKWSGQ